MVEMMYGHLADYATEGANGKMTIVNIFERVFVPVGVTDYVLPLCFLAGKIECSLSDGSAHILRFRLLDANEDEVLPPVEMPATLGSSGPGYPLSASFLVQLGGLRLPDMGDYSFEVQVDGRRIGTVRFSIMRAPT